MNKALLYITALTLTYVNLYSQSFLSGDIGGMTLTPDEVWLVLDSVWVEDGDTLTILPGTIINSTMYC